MGDVPTSPSLVDVQVDLPPVIGGDPVQLRRADEFLWAVITEHAETGLVGIHVDAVLGNGNTHGGLIRHDAKPGHVFLQRGDQTPGQRGIVGRGCPRPRSHLSLSVIQSFGNSDVYPLELASQWGSISRPAGYEMKKRMDGDNNSVKWNCQELSIVKWHT